MAELTKTDKKQLESSYEFGYSKFWNCLEQTKDKNLDTEAVGMEMLYQAIHFLETKGWDEEDILIYIKDIYKDLIDNQLYQKKVTKIKIEHRSAGNLTDNERVILKRENKILKEGDYADIEKENNDLELNKEKNSIDIANEINTEELATA
tara:strand:+ start:549 stop:998 length:450 start_codon:yes stop_codon:yes gene_type:complete